MAKMRYGNIRENKESVDVLACVINGYDTVQKIMEKLKQPQSTISMKLMALRKNNAVKKDKWSYAPDWDNLIKTMRAVLSRNVGKKLMPLFDDRRIKRIMTAYANMSEELGTRPSNMEEIAWKYLLGMSQTHGSELKRFDKRFLKLKKDLTAVSEESYLFVTSEDVPDDENGGDKNERRRS